MITRNGKLSQNMTNDHRKMENNHKKIANDHKKWQMISDHLQVALLPIKARSCFSECFLQSNTPAMIMMMITSAHDNYHQWSFWWSPMIILMITNDYFDDHQWPFYDYPMLMMMIIRYNCPAPFHFLNFFDILFSSILLGFKEFLATYFFSCFSCIFSSFLGPMVSLPNA